MEGCLTQGLVALTELRTLGFEKGRPYRGLLGRWGSRGGCIPEALQERPAEQPFSTARPFPIEQPFYPV